MPARDLYHQAVVAALVADGWTITHDPLHVRIGDRDLYIDLGAERVLAAQKADQTIAVEIKSFLGPSLVANLQQALGQYILYHDLLAETDPQRMLYLAVQVQLYEQLFTEPIGAVLLANQRLRLLVFDPAQNEVIQWIPTHPGIPSS